MDLGDAAITNTKKQCCVHLDTGHSGEAPIHIKPLGTSNKADKRIAFDKLLASIREHREYRRREKGQNSKSFITSPWSTIDSTTGKTSTFRTFASCISHFQVYYSWLKSRIQDHSLDSV